MKAMGYSVVQVPYWHWLRMKHKKIRQDYCRTSRYLALKDVRELRARSESGMGADPTKFRAQDLALNSGSSFDYHGEIFLKKDQPKRSWSWQHTSKMPIRVTI